MSEREIQVRGLDGESTTVLISSYCSVQDLKSRLKESFHLAKSSPNFHLFYKGVKMSLGTPLTTYLTNQKDFIVLVPFIKKNRIPAQCEPYDQQNALLKNSDRGTVSSANSAWSEIMQDLSVLTDNTPNVADCRVDSNNINSQERNPLMGEKCTISPNLKRKRSLSPHAREVRDHLHNILLSNSKNTFDEQNCERLRQALETVNCLSEPQTGQCLLIEKFGRISSRDADMITHAHEAKQCLCPTWLKKLLKSFTFLNIFSGFLQMCGLDVTHDRLKEALNQFNGFGLEEVSIVDVEILSILCPKVLMVGNRESASPKFGETFIFIKSCTQPEHQSESTSSKIAGKQLSTLKIIKVIEKRESAFRQEIRVVIKCFMGKTICRRPDLFSLDDLLTFMRANNADLSGGEHKLTGKNESVARCSCLGQTLCKDTNPLLPKEMVAHLRGSIGSNGQIVHVEELCARGAVYADFSNNLLGTTKKALQENGISRLYSHQAESIKASLSGKNVVVATSTSSGKSLCYNIPVLEALSQNLLSCALYLFPTKALAQDQLRALRAMTEGFGASLNIGVYDGDTCEEQRTWLRDNSRLLITNPDMLHMTILPCHRLFERILSNLRFVIIDEAHIYKGAFGCHTAFILRRLRRICSHVYGIDPSFVLCTATSANPQEHAMELVNLHSLELIQNDGSPCGPKLFLLWNPPLYFKSVLKSSRRTSGSKSADTELVARRSSSILEVSYLFAEMVQHGLRCIAFCKTRKLSELVLSYTREILEETAPFLVDTICAYRAGYTAQDRRKIESEFFEGKLHGLAATNALELGIDVGHIDATLHLGFPGSVASLWQQAGRAGRRENPSLAIYVAFEGPLDQYFMKFPQKLFGSPIECCQVNSHNQQVLEQHIACAAFEHPLSLQYDEKYFGSALDSAIKALEVNGSLASDPCRVALAKIWSYIGCKRSPSHAISIRAIETERYKVINMKINEVLEEIEESKAFFQVYEGAVYMHQGKTYLVKVFNLLEKTAFCQEADLKYYTKTRDYTDINVIGGDIPYPAKVSNIQNSRTTAQVNSCKVTTTWFGFYRIWRGSNQVFDTVNLYLPNYSYNSQAVWIRIPQLVKTSVELQKLSFRAGQHAASHALLNVVPLYIMCNSSDLGSECIHPHDTRYAPERLLLYDQHPGGIGISAQDRVCSKRDASVEMLTLNGTWETLPISKQMSACPKFLGSDVVEPIFGELLTSALELVTTCNCSSDVGCPNCIQTLTCREYNEVLDKCSAIMILQGVIESEKAYFDCHSFS